MVGIFEAVGHAVMDKMSEVTPPENPARDVGNHNSVFHYGRPEQKVYNGRSLVESVVNDIKYNGENAAQNYSITKELMRDTKEQYGIGLTLRSRTSLYERLIYNPCLN